MRPLIQTCVCQAVKQTVSSYYSYLVWKSEIHVSVVARILGLTSQKNNRQPAADVVVFFLALSMLKFSCQVVW